jgi:hypothetical protein
MKMKEIEPAQIAGLVANIGVIFGILLLAYELRQNNDLMEAEARLSRTNMVVDAWRLTAVNGELTELRARERRGEELSEGETRQVDAAVMAVFVLVAWTYGEMQEGSPELDQARAVQRYNFARFPEYPRVWEERKTTFNPAFVQWMDDNVVNQ